MFKRSTPDMRLRSNLRKTQKALQRSCLINVLQGRLALARSELKTLDYFDEFFAGVDADKLDIGDVNDFFFNKLRYPT